LPRNYLKEFNLTSTLRNASIVVVLYLVQEYIKAGVIQFIVEPLRMNKITHSIRLDILSILILVVITVWLAYLVFKRKFYPGINACINASLLISYYLLAIRLSGAYTFERTGFSKHLAYLDVFLILLIFAFTRFKYYKIAQKSPFKNGLVQDMFDSYSTPDILGRKKYALQIAVKMLETPKPDRAFVIAIIAAWGYGKTAFLSMLQKSFDQISITDFTANVKSFTTQYTNTEIELLYQEHQDTILCNYNPWKNFDQKILIQDFFAAIAKTVAAYDIQLSRNFKKYGKILTRLNDSMTSKLLESLSELFDENKSVESLFDDINASLERIGKRLVILIDDLDRLTGDELIELTRLIRNTANFKNTFFVIAYDHNYVLNTIDKQNLVTNKERYLHKIVQLEIMLPAYNPEILLQYLDEQLKHFPLLPTSYSDINNAILKIRNISISKNEAPQFREMSAQTMYLRLNNLQQADSLFFSVFENIRDVVRFINSFKITFASIGLFTDPYEIILMELLKIKFTSIHQFLIKTTFLTFTEGKYTYDQSSFTDFFTIENCYTWNIKSEDKFIISKILEALFKTDRIMFFRSIRYARYFPIFFSLQTINLESLEHLERAYENGGEELFAVLDEAAKQNKLDDLASFLLSQTAFDNQNDFENTVKALFYLAKYDVQLKITTSDHLLELFRGKNAYARFYELNGSFPQFLLPLLDNQQLDLDTRMIIAGDYLIQRVDPNITVETPNLLPAKADLQRALFNGLEQLLHASSEFNRKIYDVYIKNLSSIEKGTRQIINFSCESTRSLHLVGNIFILIPFLFIISKRISRPQSTI
jgi:hypothetical protein